jgi:hypothetical protein
MILCLTNRRRILKSLARMGHKKSGAAKGLTPLRSIPDTPETVAAKCKAAWAITATYFDHVYGKKKQTTKGSKQ